MPLLKELLWKISYLILLMRSFGSLPCLLILRIIFDLLRELIFKW